MIQLAIVTSSRKISMGIVDKNNQNLYVKPGMSTRLKTPLKPWYPHAIKVQCWCTTYNPIEQAVLTHLPNQPPTKSLLLTTMQTHNYYMQAQPTNSPPVPSYLITPKTQKVGFQTTNPQYPIPNQPKLQA